MEKIMDGMRAFVVPVQVLEDERLSVYEKMVYVVLRSFCNPHKSEAWPSIQTICRLAGIGRTKAKEVLASLEEKGYIERRANYEYDPRTKKARQTANIYTLTIPYPGRDTTKGGVATRPGGGRHATTRNQSI